MEFISCECVRCAYTFIYFVLKTFFLSLSLSLLLSAFIALENSPTTFVTLQPICSPFKFYSLHLLTQLTKWEREKILNFEWLSWLCEQFWIKDARQKVANNFFDVATIESCFEWDVFNWIAENLAVWFELVSFWMYLCNIYITQWSVVHVASV